MSAATHLRRAGQWVWQWLPLLMAGAGYVVITVFERTHVSVLERRCDLRFKGYTEVFCVTRNEQLLLNGMIFIIVATGLGWALWGMTELRRKRARQAVGGDPSNV